VDFALTSEQRAIVDAVARIAARHAGPARARALAADGGYDRALEAALSEAGFLPLPPGEAAGPLEAALVLEEVARAAGTVSAGATGLVARAVLPDAAAAGATGTVALARAGEDGPVRYAQHARALLVCDGDDVRVRSLRPGEATPIRAHYGYPVARVARAGGDRIAGAGAAMRAWWRVALAVELAATMRAALDVTVRHVCQREQFGRPIGSFQALQHRLAECHVLVEGATWLAREAAWRGAPPEAAAVAAAQASAASVRLFHECHQMNGAIGFTREHALHVWTLRLPSLRVELGGVDGHRRAASAARWS